MAPLPFRRLAGNCGVEVPGMDVRAVDDTTMGELRDLVARHAVVVLPRQHLEPEDEIAFASRWGVPHSRPGHSPIIALDSTDTRRDRPRGGGWHSDMSWAPTTPYATLLHALTIPDVGGDTIIANQCAAYDSLPDRLRSQIEGRSAEHRHPNPPGRFAAGTVVHPIVRVIPETGHRALFVNPAFTQRICDMSEPESRRVLWQLYRFATRPEVTYRHCWSAGDLVVWDNRCVVHYAIHDYTDPRLMHRITVKTAHSAMTHQPT